jgi:hypothetical protein
VAQGILVYFSDDCAMLCCAMLCCTMRTRWDLAGYLTLGGEGDSYDLRAVAALAAEAEAYAAKLDLLGND